LAEVEGGAVGAVSDLAELNAGGFVTENLIASFAGGADGIAAGVGGGAADAILDAAVGDAAANSFGEVEGVEGVISLAAALGIVVDGY